MKTALVTGSNRGLGLALWMELTSRGYAVVATARDKAHSNPDLDGVEHKDQLRLTMDVTSAISVSLAVNAFARKHKSLDLLINNAAIMEDGVNNILTISPDLLERTLRTNVGGALLVTQAFWPYLKQARGRVINISSTDSFCADPERPSYAISKCALNAATVKLSMAGQRDGVSVNACCPGWFRSDMGTDKAPMSADDAAKGVLKILDLPHELTGVFLRDGKEVVRP